MKFKSITFDDSNVTLESSEHPLNDFGPILVTDFGIIISVTEEQSSKALDSIDFTEFEFESLF